jgi:hypothetical protein
MRLDDLSHKSVSSSIKMVLVFEPVFLFILWLLNKNNSLLCCFRVINNEILDPLIDKHKGLVLLSVDLVRILRLFHDYDLNIRKYFSNFNDKKSEIHYSISDTPKPGDIIVATIVDHSVGFVLTN